MNVFFNTITTEQISWLEPEQIAYLTTVKKMEIKIEALTPTQIQAIAPESLWNYLVKNNKLNAKSLNKGLLSSFSKDQLEYFYHKGFFKIITPKQFSLLTFKQLFDLNPQITSKSWSIKQFDLFSKEQIDQLLDHNWFVNILRKQLPKLSDTLIPSLGSKFINKLLLEDIKKLNKNHIQALTSAQVQSFTAEHIAGFDKSKIKVLLEWKLLFFTHEQIQGLDKDKIQTIKPEVLYEYLADKDGYLIEKKLTKKLLSSLSNIQLNYLNTNIKNFSSENFNLLTEKQKPIINQNIKEEINFEENASEYGKSLPPRLIEPTAPPYE